MLLAYNTNGFAHHSLSDALDLLAARGYGGVALTLDVHHLNPFAPDFDSQLARTREQLQRLNLRCVIETGSRFLLDRERKHQPTLVSPRADERATRRRFLETSVRVAAALKADAVSFWSGLAVGGGELVPLWAMPAMSSSPMPAMSSSPMMPPTTQGHFRRASCTTGFGLGLAMWVPRIKSWQTDACWIAEGAACVTHRD